MKCLKTSNILYSLYHNTHTTHRHTQINIHILQITLLLELVQKSLSIQAANPLFSNTRLLFFLGLANTVVNIRNIRLKQTHTHRASPCPQLQKTCYDKQNTTGEEVQER